MEIGQDTCMVAADNIFVGSRFRVNNPVLTGWFGIRECRPERMSYLMFASRFSRPRLIRFLLVAPALVGAALFTTPAAHAQNLLTNGSFEMGNFTGQNPNGVANETQLAPGATNITGWTVLSGNNVSDITWDQNGNPYFGNAFDGVRSLDLTGFRDSAPYGGIFQTLTLTQGSTYRLSFAIGSYESNASYRGPMAVQAQVGSLNQTFTFTPSSGSTGQQWGTFTADFTATSATTTLQFSGVTSTGGQYLGLDNASITVNASGAPEPGSLALLGVGAVPLAGLVLRRRQKTTS